MSAGVTFIKMYPSDWLRGTINILDLIEEGLYCRCCMYSYERGEAVPADDMAASRVLGVNHNQYRAVMARLIAKGKMMRTNSGLINGRVRDELAKWWDQKDARVAAAKKREETKRQRRAIQPVLDLLPDDQDEAPPQSTPPVDPPSPPPESAPESVGAVVTPVISEKPLEINDKKAETCQPSTMNPETRNQKLEKEKKEPPINTPPSTNELPFAPPDEQAGPESEKGFLFEGERTVAVNGHREALEKILGGRIPFDEAMGRIAKDIDPEAKPYAQGMQAAAAMQKLTLDLDAPQRQRGSRLAKDWWPPRGWGKWATEETGLSDDWVRKQAESFRDYWCAQPGTKGRKVDWQATWRNWIRNAKKPGKEGSSFSLSGHYVGRVL